MYAPPINCNINLKFIQFTKSINNGVQTPFGFLVRVSGSPIPLSSGQYASIVKMGSL